MRRATRTPKEPLPLTPKQIRVLTFIRNFINARGYSPTMQEIADTLGVSKVTAFDHVEELIAKGYLKRSRHKARSLRLRPGAVLPDERSEHAETRLPLVGRIAAGRPIEAIEQREYLDLEDVFRSPRERFVLRVKGDSMIGDNIADGDYVIVEKRDTARNGEMVVALIDGEEATLKRFYRVKGGVRLEATNPAYEPIFAKNVQIQGVVVGVLRRY